MAAQEATTGPSITHLPTPCLLLDEQVMDRNIKRMREHLQSLGVDLRPHVKTNKSTEVTKRIVEESTHQKITVSTLAEARHFFNDGIRDIMYAVGITPQKLPDVADLMYQGARLSIILDTIQVAEEVCREGVSRGIKFRVYIELDVDGHRSGVAPEDPELIEIARLLHDSEGAELVGVMTHAGESYNCRTTDDIIAMAEQERQLSVRAAETIRDQGIPCAEVSVGSTPTATFARNLEGVTEVRAGVYVFQDLFQYGLGCCTLDELALSVLATVTTHKKGNNLAVVDAGWMAMSRDRGTASQAVDQGYGIVLDEDGRVLGGLIMTSANQEHGVISTRDGSPLDFERLPIGARVRILPNHACATAAQHSEYIVHVGTTITANWKRIGGW